MVRLAPAASRILVALGWQIGTLLAASIVVAALDLALGVRDASAVFLVAVAVVAIRSGTGAALGTALGSFLIYNFLFVEPRFTFAVASSQSVVTLLLLLGLGALIGRLAGMQRDRAIEAARNAQEARALAFISGELARVRQAREALPSIARELAAAARLERVWIGLGVTPARESIAADTDDEAPRPAPGTYATLRGGARDGWMRIRPATSAAGPTPPRTAVAGALLHRIEIRDGEEALGSVWLTRAPALGSPTASETRLLRAAAEQIGQAIRRDRLAQQANEVEIAVRSDELKTALLDSVSHDLRTPLASIRATAGNLADPELAWEPDLRLEAARQIDREAERLGRIVGAVLDLGRIRGGSLHPHLEVVPVDDLVRDVVGRQAGLLEGRPIEIEMPPEPPLLRVDPVLADQVLTNLVDNVVQHVPAGRAMRISVRPDAAGVLLIVEDAGSGIPDDVMARLFDPFVRGRGAGAAGGRGAGLGLAVVRGLTETMGGTVSARRSELGGLAVEARLPAAAAEGPPG